MPRFDYKLDIGSIVTVVIAVLTVGAMYGSINTRVHEIEDKVASFTRVMERIYSLEAQMIRLETKLDERTVREEKFDRKLEELKEHIK